MRLSIRRGAWTALTGIFACEVKDAEGERDGRRNKEADYWKCLKRDFAIGGLND